MSKITLCFILEIIMDFELVHFILFWTKIKLKLELIKVLDYPFKLD